MWWWREPGSRRSRRQQRQKGKRSVFWALDSSSAGGYVEGGRRLTARSFAAAPSIAAGPAAVQPARPLALRFARIMRAMSTVAPPPAERLMALDVFRGITIAG